MTSKYSMVIRGKQTGRFYGTWPTTFISCDKGNCEYVSRIGIKAYPSRVSGLSGNTGRQLLTQDQKERQIRGTKYQIGLYWLKKVGFSSFWIEKIGCYVNDTVTFLIFTNIYSDLLKFLIKRWCSSTRVMRVTIIFTKATRDETFNLKCCFIFS